jgi:hypothetical protein
LQDATAGDPITGLKWTRKTCRNLAKELKRKGYQVEHSTVPRVARLLGYTLRVNHKRLSRKQDKRRDQQMLYIESQRKRFARKKQVRVSRALATNSTEMAVDSNPNNWWGAGAFAPQWIQVDLGANYVIAEVRLLPSQSPAGETIHRLLVKGLATNNEYELLHTVEGVTTDFRWLILKLPEPLRGIRYIRIETTSSPSWVSWREFEVIAGE